MHFQILKGLGGVTIQFCFPALVSFKSKNEFTHVTVVDHIRRLSRRICALGLKLFNYVDKIGPQSWHGGYDGRSFSEL